MQKERYSIIANQEGRAWKFALGVYRRLREKSEDFELNRLNVKRFRDGESKVRLEKSVRGKCCYFIHDSAANGDAWFLELALTNQAMRNSSAKEIINVLPYLKFSRQDRKDESRVPISARVLADIIELYANRVLTMDVHNPSIQGFYKIPFDSLYSFPTAVKHMQNKHSDVLQDLVVMSPDTGGMTRATAFAKRLGIETVVAGYKTRKTAGEVESLRVIGDVQGKNVMIVDDILDSGGTLVKAVSAVKALGAQKVYGYCTHGLFTKGTADVLKAFDKLFVGNTVGLKDEQGIDVIRMEPIFAEAIYRLSNGMSLSQLFN